MADILLTQSRERILQDPSLSNYGKVQALTALQYAAEKAPERTPMLSYGDVVRGAIGAGLGYAVSNVFGKFLGADEDTVSKMRTVGMGLGTLLNTGLIKGASDMQDERNAFRYGFIKACVDLGFFEKDAAVVPIAIPLTPDTLLSPIRSGYNVMTQGAVGAGAGLATADAPDKTDTEIVRMELERQELERQAARLEAQKRNAALKALLKRRVAA